ncbi:glutaredoxin family protein [Ferrimonas senticii]|uniref:glutaredoxin family protein n=1 Tax=Ferrimonas senticii TaxID=394566 RepID=UPI0003F70EBD|nr:glutaredoxin family protein [Ferrimonas senticii]
MNKFIAAALLAVAATAPAQATVFKKAIEANEKYDTDIVIYSTAACDYCERADTFLDDFGVDHKRILIDGNPELIAELELFGGTSTPVLIVKGKVLQGFINNELYHTMVAVGLVDPKDHEGKAKK